MIKATCSEGRVKVEMEGAFLEILSETCAMLNSIYGGVPEHLQEGFAQEIHDKTAPGGLCWMTREQRRENAAKMLRELLARVEGKDKEPTSLGMRFEGEPVKGHPDPVGEPGEPGPPGVPEELLEELLEEFARAIYGDCSLEEMTRNAARMAMEKREAESGEGRT